MNGFQSKRLIDLCSKIGSGATPRGGKETYLNHGHIFLIRSQNILDFFFSLDGGVFISEKQARLLNNVIVQKDDVLINITGDSVARVCSVPSYINEARVNQHVAILRSNPLILSSSFLKYYLLQPQVKSLLLTLSSAGATRKALTKGVLENFEIDLPPLYLQRRIADVLIALDNKIELNRQMNHTLELMAQALYKHYFVDDIDCEKLPNGWELGTLRNITLRITKGTTPTTLKKQFVSAGINFIKVESIKEDGDFDFEKFSYIDNETNELLNRSKVQKDDLVFSIAGSLGRVGYVTEDVLPANTNQAVAIIRPDKQKINPSSSALNHLVKDDKLCQEFQLAEKRMSALVPLIKSHPRIQEVTTDILFFQHLGVTVGKVKNPPRETKLKADQIKDLIQRSIESEDIIDVYAMAGIEKPDISILNDEFLLGAKTQKSGLDIKIEILRQILNNEISLRRYKNIIKYTSLKEEVERVIQRYHENAIDSYTTIVELIKNAKEITEEDQRAQQLGLEEEELAFYEIIAKHQNAITDNKIISELVKQIVQSIKKNLQVDWFSKRTLYAMNTFIYISAHSINVMTGIVNLS